MARKRTKWLEVNDDQVAGIMQVIQQLPSKRAFGFLCKGVERQ
jgi:hypothetical protein